MAEMATRRVLFGGDCEIDTIFRSETSGLFVASDDILPVIQREKISQCLKVCRPFQLCFFRGFHRHPGDLPTQSP